MTVSNQTLPDLLRRMVLVYRVYRTKRLLHGLSDHQLRDIGVLRVEIDQLELLYRRDRTSAGKAGSRPVSLTRRDPTCFRV
jgi:uncharacterized protein YjiS (DUF1127 family)